MANSDGSCFCIVVNGKIVAWFDEFNEEAREWCTENYFGQWLAWKAKPPEMIPLTQEELKEAEHRAKNWLAMFPPES